MIKTNTPSDIFVKQVLNIGQNQREKLSEVIVNDYVFKTERGSYNLHATPLKNLSFYKRPSLERVHVLRKRSNQLRGTTTWLARLLENDPDTQGNYLEIVKKV